MLDTTTLNGRRAAPSTDHVLVDGTFSAREARDIVLAMIDANINRLKLRNLTSQVHTESPDEAAQRSIEALRATRSALLERLAQAGAEGLHLRLHSTLELEIDEAPAFR